MTQHIPADGQPHRVEMASDPVSTPTPAITGWAVVWPDGQYYSNSNCKTKEDHWLDAYYFFEAREPFSKWYNAQIAAGATCQRYRLVPDTPRSTRTPEQREAIARARTAYFHAQDNTKFVGLFTDDLRLVMEALGDE